MHSTVVANKVDLPHRTVDQTLAEGYAKTHHMLYIETSAKMRQGVYDAFHMLVREIRHRVRGQYVLCVCVCVTYVCT